MNLFIDDDFPAEYMKRHALSLQQKGGFFQIDSTMLYLNQSPTKTKQEKMHTKIFSATTVGINAHPVTIEVDLSFGMINFYIVGLPDTAIKESSKRISTALKNSGLRLPEKKITVNLAPADLKKEGTLFDLPIALGIIRAAKILEISDSYINESLVLGELSLDGGVRPVKGVLPIASDAKKLGVKRLILPQKNINEAAIIENIEIIGIKSLVDLVAFFRKEKYIAPASYSFSLKNTQSCSLDFSQVKGQETAKRALQIAASGRHNILFSDHQGLEKLC